MKSWKTLLAGAVAALGQFFESQPEPSWLPIVGKLLTGAGVFLIGMFAKDNNVTGGTVKQ